MMSYNTVPSFPERIDNLEFISDVDISHKSIMETHQSYLDYGDYPSASDYLKSQTGITPITADLLHLIQNREIALQKYLLSIEKCHRPVYGEEPAEPADQTIWIE